MAASKLNTEHITLTDDMIPQTMLDAGDAWWVSLYMINMRTITGFVVDHVEETKLDNGSTRHDIRRAGASDDEWLAKGEFVRIPKKAGVYSATTRSHSVDEHGNVTLTPPNSQQFLVTGNGAKATIHKIKYPQALQCFGVEPQQRQQAARTNTKVRATA